jgi:hypothetical protein
MRFQALIPPRSLVLAAFLLASVAAMAGGRADVAQGPSVAPLPVQAASCLGAAGGIVEPGACVIQEVTL